MISLQMTRDFTKGARASFYIMLSFMGGMFWVASATGRFTMSPDIYGASAYHLPAGFWAMGMFLPSAIYMMALSINGRRPWTPYVRLACGFLISSYFSAIVWGAVPATQGSFMVIASTTMMCKAAVLTYIDALELFRQWGWHDK